MPFDNPYEILNSDTAISLCRVYGLSKRVSLPIDPAEILQSLSDISSSTLNSGGFSRSISDKGVSITASVILYNAKAKTGITKLYGCAVVYHGATDLVLFADNSDKVITMSSPLDFVKVQFGLTDIKAPT